MPDTPTTLSDYIKLYNPVRADPEGNVSINPPDDIEGATSDGTDTALGSYLSGLTNDPAEGNPYPISVESGTQEFTYREDDGSPSPLGGLPGDDTPHFMEGWDSSPSTSAAKNSFVELSSNAAMQEAEPTDQGTVSELVNKSGQHGGVAAGQILPSFKSTLDENEVGIGASDGSHWHEVPASAPPLQKKISNVLKTNRFSPGNSSPYIKDGEYTDEYGGGGIPEQSKFGVYDAAPTDGVPLSELSKVAEALLLRQTGHNLGSGDPTNLTGAMVRNANVYQRGKDKLDVSFTMAKNAYGAPTKPELQNAELRYDDISGDPLTARKTYGALNSNLEPFQKKNRLAMVTVAGHGFINFIIQGVVISGVIDLIDGSSTASGTSDPTTMKKGQHIPEAARIRVLRILGVPRTRYSFTKCFIYGAVEFLGLSLDPGALPPGMGGGGGGDWSDWADWWSALTDGITDIALNVIFSAGYYANVMRVVNRDFERLIDAFSDIEFSDADDVVAMFRLIGKLNSYTSFRFFMSLATIGEKALERKQRRFPLGGKAKNPLEKMPDNGRTRIAKSRISASKRQLVWRHRSAPAMLLLPKQTRNAYKVFDMTTELVDATMTKIGDAKRKKLAANPYPLRQRRFKTQATSRLSKSVREAMENELEMEYMPFYFHDLRTNEIMSFHAFLGKVSDSYSVKWNDTGGYGRIEPVKIYNSTARKISLQFHMVATSKADFDSLWFSVNKLVSMLYPQWSMGKKVRAGSKKFVMPFSQIPTASPIIRLRVGDVIKSNYSRFNLARLFGMAEARPAATAADGGSAATSVTSDAPFDLSYESAQAAADDATAAADWEVYTDAVEALEERVETEPTSAADTAHGYAVGEFCFLEASPSVGYTTWDRGSTWNSTPPPDATHVETTPFRTRTTIDDLIEVGERMYIGAAEGAAMQEDGAANHVIEYRVRFVDRDSYADQWRPASEKGHWHEYIVRQGDMYPIYPEFSGSVAPPQTVTLEEQVTNIHNFFSPTNNAIVQSFESAGGKGLAGTINSFDMDWGDAPWETGELGSRAPQFMKISIGFSPIHDIIPGLDNNGWMRTFNYPVGRIAGGLNTDHYDSASPPTVNVGGGSGDSRRAGGPDAGLGTRTEWDREEAAAFGADGGAGETD